MDELEGGGVLLPVSHVTVMSNDDCNNVLVMIYQAKCDVQGEVGVPRSQ